MDIGGIEVMLMKVGNMKQGCSWVPVITRAMVRRTSQNRTFEARQRG